jgi:phage shock protein A
MFAVLKTLISGASARAEDRVTDMFAIDLIEQKIREAEAGLNAAKQALASVILRERQERLAADGVDRRIADLEIRARAALTAGSDALALEAAEAIAQLENERTVRRETLAQLTGRIARMRASVDKAHRRLIDLKQGLATARAVDLERRAQGRLDRALGSSAPAREAEALIARVMNGADPLAETEVLDEIDANLDRSDVAGRLAKAGFGDRLTFDADAVLARLRATSNA